MTPAKFPADDSKLSFAAFWRITTAISVVCFPVAIAVGGYFAGKILDHDTQLAVMRASYTTRDDTEARENGLKQSIDSLKSAISDLRVDIVKLTEKGEKQTGNSGK